MIIPSLPESNPVSHQPGPMSHSDSFLIQLNSKTSPDQSPLAEDNSKESTLPHDEKMNDVPYSITLVAKLSRDSMPPYSRLFIGNLYGERTSAKDIADVFVKVVIPNSSMAIF
jgi:hypothetical protein